MAGRNAPAFAASELVEILRAKKQREGGDRWWKGTVVIEGSFRETVSKTTRWASIQVRNAAGVLCPVRIRMYNERTRGSIPPYRASDLTNRDGEKGARETTGFKPAIQIMKWSGYVEVAADRITRTATPPDSELSAYYGAIELLNEAVKGEVTERLQRGARLLESKAASLEDALRDVGATAPSEIFIERGSAVRTLLARWPSLSARVTMVERAKYIEMTQEEFRAGENEGRALPNPITRITLRLSASRGARDGSDAQSASRGARDNSDTQLYDKSRKVGSAYEAGLVDGEPVCDENVHQFIPSGSRVDGIVRTDGLCLSSAGISVPISATALVVERPAEATDALDELYQDVPPAAPAAPAAAAAAAAAGDDDLGLE